MTKRRKWAWFFLVLGLIGAFDIALRAEIGQSAVGIIATYIFIFALDLSLIWIIVGLVLFIKGKKK